MKRPQTSRLVTAALGLSVSMTAALPAFALTTPNELAEHQGLESAEGLQPRKQRQVAKTVPFTAARAWTRFAEREGPGWHAWFDAQTGVPGRIVGGSILVPRSSADGAVAERAARELLERHVALLAPGSSAEDFALSANDFDGDIRTVAFVQRARGLEVEGGQVSFRFKKDRLFVIGSEALPEVRAEAGARIVDRESAAASAVKWIAEDFGPGAKVGSVGAPRVLPLVPASGEIGYRVVVPVVVSSQKPLGKWNVYVDATTGARVAREQTLKFAAGTLKMNVPERWPGGTRVDLPAPIVALNVGGSSGLTDATGGFTWTASTAIAVRAGVSGDRVAVINAIGPEVTASFTLEDGGTYVWDRRSTETDDAQLITFIAAGQAKEYAKGIAPGAQWLAGSTAEANVNLESNCNAFSDGTSINFFQSSRQCENTGRLPDVVYHEFGHSVHAHAVIRGAGRFETALSEGASDYLAATITDDPGMGRGFFRSNQPLRHIDPATTEARWPDDISNDPHETGLIFAGAMWDLRKALILAQGKADGVRRADKLWYAVLQRAVDIPSTHAEVLAADDDDGNLGNGTPNKCLIDEIFSAHGLADPATLSGGISTPTVTGLEVKLPVTQSANVCPGRGIAGVTLTWRHRSDANITGTVQMTSENGGWRGVIPTQPAGVVVQYKLDVRFQNNESQVFPNNAADPWYEMYIGQVTPLYCTDFENDPAAEGWTHALLRGTARQGADDWTWGEPEGTDGSGDPSAAYSGTHVIGNDLGGGNNNGQYQASKINTMVAPEVDTMDFSTVRLQYRRWLNVEDGTYDQATIYAGDMKVWQNLATGENGTTHHQDREWRFHDVDLSDAVTNGKVKVRFEIASDEGLNLGGWTIDDFCIVGVNPVQVPRCGDGHLDQGEVCDDGNQVDDDGCKNDCTVPVMMPPPPPLAVCGNGVVESGEACDLGAQNGAGACSPTCTPVEPGLKVIEGEGGCGCSTSHAGGRSGLAGALALLALALVLRRRVR